MPRFRMLAIVVLLYHDLLTGKVDFVNTTYRKKGRKATELFVGKQILRKQQSSGDTLRDDIVKQGREHLICRLLFQRHLGMAVGAFQERGVAVTGQFRYRLLVHTTVKHGGYEIVPQRMQVVVPGETVFVKELAKVFGEGVGMDEVTFFVDKQILGETVFALSCFLVLVVAI